MGFDIGPVIGIEGEAEFKRAITDIDRQMNVLGSEMKKVTAQFSDNADSMEALTAKHDVLGRKADEQRNKIQTLTAALENAKRQYGENSAQVQNWQIKINNAEADLARTESQIRQTAGQIENFGRETHEAAGLMDEAGQRALSFGDVLKANILGTAIVDGIHAIGSAFTNFASDALGAADSLQQQADVTGLTAERLQELQYIGNNLGVSLDTVTGAQTKLTKSMFAAKDGTGAQADAFKQLGISVLDSNGNMRDAKVVMEEAFTALNGVGNETERNQLAMQLFGKSAMDLNPIIAAGGEELNRLAQKARDSGVVMSSETIAALDTFGDSMDNVKSSAMGIVGTMLGELAPSMTTFAENINGIDTKPLTDGLKFLMDNAATIGAGLAGIAAGLVAMNVTSMITGVVGAIKEFKLAQEAATVAQTGLNFAMKANIIGIVVTAVAALVTALVVLWKTNDGFREAVTGAWNAVKDAVVGVVTAVVGFVKKNWESLLLLLVNPIAGAIKLMYDLNPKFKAWVDGLLAGFKSWFSGMLGIGKNIVDGLWSGISGAKDWLLEKVKEWCGNILGGIKAFFGIHSPSRVMRDEVGLMLAKGVAVGIDNGAAIAQESAKKMGKAIVNELTSLNEQLAKAESDTAKAGLQEKIKALEEFQRDYESTLSALETKQQSMADKISGYGKLFESAKSEDGKDLLQLGNLQGEIDKIAEYGNALDALKDRGISDSLMSEITSMNIDDAVSYANLLLQKTPEEYDKYMKLWDEKQKLAGETAKRFYSDEFAQLQTEFVDKVPTELGKLKTEMEGIGKNSAEGLADGFWSKKSYIISTFKTVLESALQEAKAAMEIHSPSRKWAEVGKYMADGLGVGFTDRMDSVARQINNSIPVATDPMTQTNRTVEGMVNGLAPMFAMNQAHSGQPIILQTFLDGKMVAQSVFDPLRDVSKQRGVAFW